MNCIFPNMIDLTKDIDPAEVEAKLKAFLTRRIPECDDSSDFSDVSSVSSDDSSSNPFKLKSLLAYQRSLSNHSSKVNRKNVGCSKNTSQLSGESDFGIFESNIDSRTPKIKIEKSNQPDENENHNQIKKKMRYSDDVADKSTEHGNDILTDETTLPGSSRIATKYNVRDNDSDTGLSGGESGSCCIGRNLLVREERSQIPGAINDQSSHSSKRISEQEQENNSTNTNGVQRTIYIQNHKLKPTLEDKIRRREVCGKLFDGWMKRQRDNVQRRINILENNIRQDLRRITHYDREQIERLINGTDHPSRVRAIYAEAIATLLEEYEQGKKQLLDSSKRKCNVLNSVHKEITKLNQWSSSDDDDYYDDDYYDVD